MVVDSISFETVVVVAAVVDVVAAAVEDSVVGFDTIATVAVVEDSVVGSLVAVDSRCSFD